MSNHAFKPLPKIKKITRCLISQWSSNDSSSPYNFLNLIVFVRFIILKLIFPKFQKWTNEIFQVFFHIPTGVKINIKPINPAGICLFHFFGSINFRIYGSFLMKKPTCKIENSYKNVNKSQTNFHLENRLRWLDNKETNKKKWKYSEFSDGTTGTNTKHSCG